MSSGVFSYSYYSEEKLVEIEYYRGHDNKDVSCVKRISLVVRVNSPSPFSLLLGEDLP